MKALGERQSRWLLVLLAIACSIAGIVVGLANGQPADGGRGGAVAVALTLVAFFLRRKVGLELQRTITETGPAIDTGLSQLEARRPSADEPDPALAALAARVRSLEAVARVNETSDGKMAAAVATASAIGTLTWGFGDLIVTALM